MTSTFYVIRFHVSYSYLQKSSTENTSLTTLDIQSLFCVYPATALTCLVCYKIETVVIGDVVLVAS